MENTQLLSALQETGLTDKEARVYLAMIELGESSIIPIAERAGIKRTTVYNYLESFRQLGLISMVVRNRRQHYIAASPARLKEIMEARLRKVDDVVPLLFSLYKQEDAKPSVQMFEGVEGIKEVFRLSLEAEHKEIRAIPVYASGHSHVGNKFIEDYLDQVAKRKIKYISLRLAKDMDEYTKTGYKKVSIAPGENREARTAPEWFTPESHIHMYDDKVAIFSQTKERPYAMLITSASYYQTMRMFFEGVWREGKVF